MDARVGVLWAVPSWLVISYDQVCPGLNTRLKHSGLSADTKAHK